MQISRKMISGHLCFLFFTAVTLILFYTPLRDLMILSFHKEVYSHIILVPLVSGYFFYLNRKAIFSNVRRSFVPGGMVVILGVIVYLIGTYYGQRLNRNDYLSLMTLITQNHTEACVQNCRPIIGIYIHGANLRCEYVHSQHKCLIATTITFSNSKLFSPGLERLRGLGPMRSLMLLDSWSVPGLSTFIPTLILTSFQTVQAGPK